MTSRKLKVVRTGNSRGKLSWEETARAMAISGEDWSDWEGTIGDGLADRA